MNIPQALDLTKNVHLSKIQSTAKENILSLSRGKKTFESESVLLSQADDSQQRLYKEQE